LVHLNFDFESDLRREILNQFERIGVKPPSGDVGDILMDLLSVRRKLIPPIIRTVKYNPELLAQLPLHPKRSEIKVLDKLFSQGGNVNRFQSKRLFQSQFHDHLCYEWSIFHFHLSTEVDKGNPYFVKQVKQLLFVFISDEEAIFLGTDNHFNGTFGDVKWLEVLHDHFHYTIEPHYDKGMKIVYPEVDGVGRQNLWDKGYSLVGTNVRGKVYINPGLGRMTSGHNTKVSMHSNEIMRWVYTMTRQFTSFRDEIADWLKIESELAEFYLTLSPVLQIRERKSKKDIISFPYSFVEDPLKEN